MNEKEYELIKYLHNRVDKIESISYSELKVEFGEVDFSTPFYSADSLEKLKIKGIEGIQNEELELIVNKLTQIKAKEFLESQNTDTFENNPKSDEKQFKDYLMNELNFEVKEIKQIDDELSLKIKINDKFNMKYRDYIDWKFDNIVETYSQKFGVPENKIYLINSLSDYFESLSKLEELKLCLSRGQKDCSYEITPSLFRVEKNEKALMEKEFLELFKRKASFYDSKISTKSEESLIAYGQHYGLPTRYLDFTEAHLLSLFFAVEEYEYNSKPGIVYLINAQSVNMKNIKQSVKALDYSERHNVEANSKYKERPHFIKLEDANERIHFQKGFFLRIPDNEGLIEEILKENTHVMIINPDNKKEILKELFSMGITYESIYPDLDNLIKNIKFQHQVGEI